MKDEVFIRQLKTASASGAAALENIKLSRKVSREALAEAICTYIGLRYMLGRTPGREENLYALAEESVKSMLAAGKDRLLAIERESGCTGATSGMMKKVLLLLSIKRALGSMRSEDDFVAAETVEDLIRLCAE